MLICKKNGICYYNLLVATKMSHRITKGLEKECSDLVGISFNLERMVRTYALYTFDDSDFVNLDKELKILIKKECKSCLHAEREPYTGVSYDSVLRFAED